ncbi:MAG: hypothetical protein O2895_03625 [Chloroflexi bacterium]|nr:hypothetical protein [Chloroflexota bacterium]
MHLVDYFPRAATAALLVRLAAAWAVPWAAFGGFFWFAIAADDGVEALDPLLRLLALALTVFAACSCLFLATIAIRAPALTAPARGRRVLATGAAVALCSHVLVLSVASPVFFAPATLVLSWRALRA